MPCVQGMGTTGALDATYVNTAHVNATRIKNACETYTKQARITNIVSMGLAAAPLITIGTGLCIGLYNYHHYASQSQLEMLKKSIEAANAIPTVENRISWGSWIGSGALSLAQFTGTNLFTLCLSMICNHSFQSIMNSASNRFGPVIINAPYSWFIQQQISGAQQKASMPRPLYWFIELLDNLEYAIQYQAPALIQQHVEKIIGHMHYVQNSLEPHEFIYRTEIDLICTKVTDLTNALLATATTATQYIQYQQDMHTTLARLVLVPAYRAS